MKECVSDIERKVLAVLQKGFPKSQSPYEDMAAQIGIETAELLAILQDWKKQGKLRRVGAIVDHRKVGFGASAMIVWQVPKQAIEQAGQTLAGFEEVSHVYQRNTSDTWPYNLYTMVHAADEQALAKVIGKMSRVCGISEYRVLVTERELKKVPPTYIE